MLEQSATVNMCSVLIQLKREKACIISAHCYHALRMSHTMYSAVLLVFLTLLTSGQLKGNIHNGNQQLYHKYVLNSKEIVISMLS